jgi:hypothetical protein
MAKAIGIQVDNGSNQSTGSKGTSKDSLYFRAEASGSGDYQVTLNYGTGHWCTCRGMVSKVRKFGGIGGHNPNQNLRLQQTERHHCKHIHAVRSADPSIRIEARKIRNNHFGIMETATDPETGATEAPVVAQAPTTGRKAAVAGSRAAKAKRGDGNARERIVELEAQMEKMRAQIEIEDAIHALTKKHGADAVKGVVTAALTEAA